MKKDITVEIGALIRRLRVESNLSQEDLAFECDLHRTYIGSLERGEKATTVLTLAKILKALNISMADFFKELDH